MTTGVLNSIASSLTKANNQGGVTVVPVTPPRRITYIFSGVSSSNLKIPYAVAVNGNVLPEYASKPRRVRCCTGSAGNGTVTVTIQQGQTVSLYLNTDAHPEFRRQPVYALTADERDAEILIKEKFGKHTDADTPVKRFDADPDKEAAKLADTYTAPLTGNIWMKVSHRYTEAQAEALLPANTEVAIRESVKLIYRGLPNATLVVTRPATFAKPAHTLTVMFTDSNNPKDNICSYSLLIDGLPRVHPAGCAALLTAAMHNDIATLTVSSCWRPLLGSIAHRAGLGLDVSVLRNSIINREELRHAFIGKNATQRGDGDDGDNITDAEVAAFGEYETAIKAAKTAESNRQNSARALMVAKKSDDVDTIEAAEAELEASKSVAEKAEEMKINTKHPRRKTVVLKNLPIFGDLDLAYWSVRL